jgi:hypothetical protein
MSESHRLRAKIERANQVAMTCWRAADSGNERICDMARREEAEYEQRYGVSHRQMMTINYNDYLRTKDYGYCKSC